MFASAKDAKPGLERASRGNHFLNSKPDESRVQGIEIIGVDKAGVTQPKSDGTRGSGLYKVPFKLSARPPSGWDEFFVNAWDHPESFTTMHRPPASHGS